ncbi:MAG: hypothetical protein QOJ66_2500 [Ilumatobacteraceae bacterium]
MDARSNLGTRGVVVLVVLVASVVGVFWFGLHQGTVQLVDDQRSVRGGTVRDQAGMFGAASVR